MANRAYFDEDLLPRRIPNTKKLLQQKNAVLSKPTLGSVSLPADKTKILKSVPKKSFQKWKRQHEAIFKDNANHNQNQYPKHPVSAHINQTNDYFSKKPLPCARSTKSNAGIQNIPIHQSDNKCHFVQQNRFSHDYSKFAGDRNFLRNVTANPKMAESSENVDNVAHVGLQRMMKFAQLNRMARTEALKGAMNTFDDRSPNSIQNELYEMNQNGDAMMNWFCPVNHTNQCVSNNIGHTTTDNSPNGDQIEAVACINALPLPSDIQLMNQSNVHKHKPNKSLTTEALVSIVEEQIQIVEQQKHILMQQNEIFSLQYKIEKLMLRNGEVSNSLPTKHYPAITNCEQTMTSSGAKTTFHNGSTLTASNGSKSRKSIGVMTSFHGNLNTFESKENHKFNEKVPTVKDTMMEKINRIIKHSPPMINYKTKGIVSPRERVDVNISTQTLIYKAARRNNGYVNEQKLADRSFAVHLLGMKYRPEEVATTNRRLRPNLNALNDSLGNLNHNSPQSIVNDHGPSNISPAGYDYLLRHGLLKK